MAEAWSPEARKLFSHVEGLVGVLGLFTSEAYVLWNTCAHEYGPESPPAIGCLLALVREAWNPRNIYEDIRRGGGGSLLLVGTAGRTLFDTSGGTRPQRLALALKAATDR